MREHLSFAGSKHLYSGRTVYKLRALLSPFFGHEELAKSMYILLFGISSETSMQIPMDLLFPAID